MQFNFIFCCCFLLDIISECGIISMKKSCISQLNRKNNNCRKEIANDRKDRNDG